MNVFYFFLCDQRIFNLKKAFLQEMSWASHLTLGAVMIPTPNYDCANYASVVNCIINTVHYVNIWVRIPLINKSASDNVCNIQVFFFKKIDLKFRLL